MDDTRKRIVDMIDGVAAGEDPRRVFTEAVQTPELIESSLSRIRQHMLDHDSGFVTASRGDQTYAQNKKRNLQLRAAIQKKYHVTSLRGAYIENYNTPDSREVGETSFFVVDYQDKGHLEKDLIEFGQLFKENPQDLVLYVPKGAEEGIIIGTRDVLWPGLGKKFKLGHPIFGKAGEFMTKVRGRPFVFESVEDQGIVEYECDWGRGGFFGELGRHAFIHGEEIE